MTTVLYGECIGSRGTARVRISELADRGCDIEAEDAQAVFDEEFALWIGAVGPIAATAASKVGSHLAVRFKEPVDGRILQHFNGG
jgi:hypothetical protein